MKGLLLVPLALALPLAAGAQEAPPPTFEERIEVTEVLLDVLVSDREGNVIIGLGPEDFVVEEDGKEVPVQGVTFYSNRRFLETAGAATKLRIDPDEVPQDRYFVLFFHDQRAANVESPGLMARQLEAGREARKWVRGELLPNDWAAVVSYDQKLKVQADFTRDRGALERAIGDAVAGKDPGGNWPSRLPAAAPGRDQPPSLLAGLPSGNELRDRTPTVYEGLQVLARALGNVRGRKNLLLFTIGFGRVNPFGLYEPDPRYYPDTKQALNDHNVAVYAVDLVPTGTEHTMANAMHQLADETGGRYLFNFTSFASPLRQIAEENNGYYLLAYQSRHPAGEQGYREVTVKTRNPEFRVRAREGYRFGD